MNKKELAISAIKHPIIQKLLETKLASSREILRLILEELGILTVPSGPPEVRKRILKNKAEAVVDSGNLTDWHDNYHQLIASWDEQTPESVSNKKERLENAENFAKVYQEYLESKGTATGTSGKDTILKKISNLDSGINVRPSLLKILNKKLGLPEEATPWIAAVPAAEPTTEPAAEPAVEPATEPAAEPAAEPATEPATEPEEVPPTEEPIITATVEIDEETANNYSNALEDFQRKFLNVRTLREQAAVLEPYFNIIKKLAGKLEPEEAKALTRTLEEEEGSKLNRDIVNTSNILIKHMDKIEEVLQAFKESAQTGTLGSNKLYLKYGEGDPKKFLMKFLKIVIKDINSLDEMFNRALLSGGEVDPRYDFDATMEESLNEEKTEMSTDEIIDLVQEVHEVVSDEGEKLKAILFNTISGEERAEETISEETETDISVKDQAEAIYNQLARIQGFFPSISPFNNEYGFDEIIKNFIQVVRGLHGLIAQINRYSRTNEKITEPLARSIQEKMQNIKSYLMNVFGVSDTAEKASTIGSLSDAGEGTEYVYGEAAPTELGKEDFDLALSAEREYDFSDPDALPKRLTPLKKKEIAAAAAEEEIEEQLTKKLKPIIERMLNG